MTPRAPRHRRVQPPAHWPRSAIVIAALATALVGVIVVTLLATSDGMGAGDSPQSEEATPPMRIGYVPYWDQDRAFDVAMQNIDQLDEVSPVWFSLEPTGEVTLTDTENTTVDLEAVRSLQAQGVRVIPTVTNLRDGEWDPEAVQAMLHSPEAMQTHVNELVELAVAQGYDGIDIDYEHLRAADRGVYTEFLTALGEALHAEDKLLTTAVHPKTSDAGYAERNQAQDYEAIGAAADQVRVMTYDYSWESSPPGPVAPTQWVEEVIAWTVSQIPSHKVVLGIVLLGYDWVEGTGATVDFEQAQERATTHGATIRRGYDRSPSFRYEDSSGREREVWYEDAVSVATKLPLVDEYDLGGVFLWRLGGEDPNVWPTMQATFDQGQSD